MSQYPGPYPILGDHEEQRFLVRVEMSIGLSGRIEDEEHLKRALAENFADMVANYQEAHMLDDHLEVVHSEPAADSGLPPAPGDLADEWTSQDNLEGIRQGWLLADCGGRIEIQKIDNPDDIVDQRSRPMREFGDDGEAATFVQATADAGDPVCRKAIEQLIYYRSPDVARFNLRRTWR